MISYGRMPPTSGWNGSIKTECSGDDCPCRHGESVHPPLLLAFDPEAGEYTRAEGRCTAQWASSQRSRVAGQICGQEAEHQIGDMWVCEYHYQRAREWFKEVQPRIDTRLTIERVNAIQAEIQKREREDHKERLRLRREEAALERELAKQRIRAEAEERAGRNVVYYLQRESDGMIKIGYSGNLASRLSNLKGDHGSLSLLATHIGGHPEETALHGQFSAQRITVRGEWFRPELPLMKHIADMRRRHGTPQGEKLPPVASFASIQQAVRKLTAEASLAAEPAA